MRMHMKSEESHPPLKKSPQSIIKKVLITGATGFVGHHFVEHLLKNKDWEITTLDRLVSSGHLNRLKSVGAWEMGKDRVRIVKHDLKEMINESVAKELEGPFDYIVHLAGLSHVDSSIENPLRFFLDNCIGTVHLLNYARDKGLKKDGKLQFFSTDQVFGPAPEGIAFKEWDRHNPNNPYASSKSAAEQACIAYAHTYKMPIFITNAMNIFGERQHREKFIPLIIRNVLEGKSIPIHSDELKTEAGKRHYLHARNISAASLWLLEGGRLLDGSGKQGRYNFVGEVEIDNLSLAKLVADMINDYMREKGKAPKSFKYDLVDFHTSRPGHDLRYALDGSLLRKEGFTYPVTFEQSLRKVVYWTLEHPEWQ
jgi:dTDP-glucose 4,6-dehydratase